MSKVRDLKILIGVIYTIIIEIVQTNFYIVKINVLDLFAFRRIKNGKT